MKGKNIFLEELERKEYLYIVPNNFMVSTYFFQVLSLYTISVYIYSRKLNEAT